MSGRRKISATIVVIGLLGLLFAGGLHGLEATRRIISGSPHMRILILTMSDDTETVFYALQEGARGYILKGARKADIVRSVQNVYHGEVVFGAAVAQHVIQHFTRSPSASKHAAATPRKKA